MSQLVNDWSQLARIWNYIKREILKNTDSYICAANTDDDSVFNSKCNYNHEKEGYVKCVLRG
jgi:hypothetical protein